MKSQADGGSFVDRGCRDDGPAAARAVRRVAQHRGGGAARRRTIDGRHRGARVRNERHAGARSRRCRQWRSAICWRFATRARTASVMASNYNRRPVGRRGAGRRRVAGADSAAPDRSTTCCSGINDAHRVRRTGPERQGDAGAAIARAPEQRRPEGARRCRFPITTRRSARRSGRRWPASASSVRT